MTQRPTGPTSRAERDITQHPNYPAVCAMLADAIAWTDSLTIEELTAVGAADFLASPDGSQAGAELQRTFEALEGLPGYFSEVVTVAIDNVGAIPDVAHWMLEAALAGVAFGVKSMVQPWMNVRRASSSVEAITSKAVAA